MELPRSQNHNSNQRRELVQLEISRYLSEQLNAISREYKISRESALELLLRNADKVQVEISLDLLEQLDEIANEYRISRESALELLLRNAGSIDRKPSGTISIRNLGVIRRLSSNWIAAFTAAMFIVGMLLAVIYIVHK